MSKKASCRSEIVVVWGKVGSDNTGRGGGGTSGGWGKNCLQNRALEAQSGRPEQIREKLARTLDEVKKSCTGNVSKAA